MEDLRNKRKFAFLDVQGFKRDFNSFVVKEFCLISDDFEFHEIVKSPCTFNELNHYYKRQADWVTRKYHGLKFEAGTITLDELVERTLEYVIGKTILVKGIEKVEWVHQIYGDHCYVRCENIEHHDSFVTTMRNKAEIWSICTHHGQFHRYNNCRCALANARSLRNFILYP